MMVSPSLRANDQEPLMILEEGVYTHLGQCPRPTQVQTNRASEILYVDFEYRDSQTFSGGPKEPCS